MSHFTLKSGVAEEVRTRCCPICLRRYPYQKSDGYATLGCEEWDHLAQYEEKVRRLASMAMPFSYTWIVPFDRYNHILDSRVADYAAYHAGTLPADCHLPQEPPHEPVA